MSTPYDYYPACLYAIQQLGQGYTLTQACNAANITVALFRRYCANDPNLNDQFIDAEQRSHDALADALVHINPNLQPSTSNAPSAPLTAVANGGGFVLITQSASAGTFSYLGGFSIRQVPV